MRVKCRINSLAYEDEEGIIFNVYSLSFYYIGLEDEFVKIIENIFVDEHKIYTLYNLINSSNLDGIHIDDTIYDAICGINYNITL